MGMLCQYFHAPGGAQYGGSRFVSKVRTFARKDDACRIILAGDSARDSTWRIELFPKYKANRPERDAATQMALDEQHTIARQQLKEDGATFLMAHSYEADDVAATVATRVAEAGLCAVVFSSDKDMCQLVSDDIRLHDGHFEMTRQLVHTTHGVYPEQIADYLAVIGDGCDNIPGAKGIGPRGAKELFTKYGNLRTMLQESKRLVEANPSVKLPLERKLLASASEVCMYRRLTEVCRNVPIAMPWERCA